METTGPLQMGRVEDDLETFLVEWKPADSRGLLRDLGSLETFLVEWKRGGAKT